MAVLALTAGVLAEPMRRTTVTLSDVDRLTPTTRPQVLGTPRLGQRLRATSGSWNTAGLSFDYQWLRGGAPIPGATSATRRVQRADLGRRLAVRVRAAKPGLDPASATSVRTAPVQRARAAATVVPSASSDRAGRAVRTVVRVTAPGASPAGRVRVRLDGRTVRTATLRDGRAVVRVPVPRGRHRITARYLGSPAVAPTTSPPAVVRGR